jgi:hypothetical protein
MHDFSENGILSTNTLYQQLKMTVAAEQTGQNALPIFFHYTNLGTPVPKLS